MFAFVACIDHTVTIIGEVISLTIVMFERVKIEMNEK